MAREFESRVAAALREYAPAAHGARYAFESADGRRIVELKTRLQGVRDLDAAVVQLSKVLAERKEVRQAYLIVKLPRVTDDRLSAEWIALHRVVRPEVMRRLALIAVGRQPPWVSREDPALHRIAEAANAAILAATDARLDERPSQPSRRFFEVFKVLLNAWLLGKEPLSLRYLVERTGFSYPTVADAVRRLKASREIETGRKRSLVLRVFPRQTWSELLALSRSVRATQLFVDGAGRRPDPAVLLRRLRRGAGKGLALGGVVAARYWDPRFDLNGLPRLDVCTTASRAQPLPKLGLVPVEGVSREHAILALHLVERADPLFEADPKGGLPYADPVETLLDLHELRLIDQADQMIERLRARRA